MPEQYETKAADTAAPPTRPQARGAAFDLLAFLGVLVFVGGLTLLIDHTGQFSARLVFSGAAGLVVSGVMAWRRLRRPGPHRWRSGQAVYHGRRVVVVSAWGVEGRPLPAIEPPAVADAGVPAAGDQRHEEPQSLPDNCR